MKREKLQKIAKMALFGTENEKKTALEILRKNGIHSPETLLSDIRGPKKTRKHKTVRTNPNMDSQDYEYLSDILKKISDERLVGTFVILKEAKEYFLSILERNINDLLKK